MFSDYRDTRVILFQYTSSHWIWPSALIPNSPTGDNDLGHREMSSANDIPSRSWFRLVHTVWTGLPNCCKIVVLPTSGCQRRLTLRLEGGMKGSRFSSENTTTEGIEKQASYYTPFNSCVVSTRTDNIGNTLAWRLLKFLSLLGAQRLKRPLWYKNKFLHSAPTPYFCEIGLRTI